LPEDSVRNRSAWQFISGFTASGTPTWSADIGKRVAVLHDDQRIYPDVYTVNRARNLSVISELAVDQDQARRLRHDDPVEVHQRRRQVDVAPVERLPVRRRFPRRRALGVHVLAAQDAPRAVKTSSSGRDELSTTLIG
jgi:hypothetical protein